MRNEVGKLSFLLAMQQYLQRDAAQQVRGVRSHPERRKPEKKDYDLDEWGIYIANCYASNKKTPPYLFGKAHIITAEHLVKNVFPQRSWYIGTQQSIPIMVDPQRRYQGIRMMEYW